MTEKGHLFQIALSNFLKETGHGGRTWLAQESGISSATIGRMRNGESTKPKSMDRVLAVLEQEGYWSGTGPAEPTPEITRPTGDPAQEVQEAAQLLKGTLHMIENEAVSLAQKVEMMQVNLKTILALLPLIQHNIPPDTSPAPDSPD